MSYRLRVKVCGITHPDDLAVALDAGADAIGFNFHPSSPRYVTLERARELLATFPPFVEPVGVFVRKSLEELSPLLDHLGFLRTVQMHGGGYAEAEPFPFRYLPAFQVRERTDLDVVSAYLERCRRAGWSPSGVLLDGYAPGLTGGTGVTAPWHLLEAYQPGVPLILAGGLTPENVAEAVRRVRPYAVDVASGVEVSPGRKDPEKVRRFLDAARSA